MATSKGTCDMTFSRSEIEEKAKKYTAAWNSGKLEAVAGHYAENGAIVINQGDPWKGREGVSEMAAGFFRDVPGLKLSCDMVRGAGTHVVYMWTFTGHDATTGNPLSIAGWEEWDLSEKMEIVSSRGWFDADDYTRQVEGK